MEQVEEKDILLKKEYLERLLNKYFNKCNMNNEKKWYSYIDISVWENYGKKRCYFKIVDVHVNEHCASKTRRCVTKFGYLDMLTGEYVVNHDEKNLYNLNEQQ